MCLFCIFDLLGSKGGVGGPVVLELGVAELLPSVHVESACTTAEPITLGPVAAPVAGLGAV